MEVYKPKLVELYGKLSFGIYKWQTTGITFPDITAYTLQVSVRNATEILLGSRQTHLTEGTYYDIPAPPRIKSIDMDWTYRWAYSPLGVQIGATFKLCQSPDRCQTFVARPNVTLRGKFQKFSQWWVTTNKPPLQFRSSSKGTGDLEHEGINLNVENGMFYNGNWSKLFEKEIKNLVLQIVGDIRRKLRHALDVWFDEHVFPAFARQLTSSEDFD